MRKSRQLIAESAVIGAILIVITLGGSITTTAVPPSWSNNLDPNLVVRYSDLNALALYYNATLTDLGKGRFSNVSLLISTFHSVNIPPSVDEPALAAIGDVASMNATIPKASTLFDETKLAIGAKEYVNASALVNQGCANEASAGQSLSDFSGTQTPRLSALSVPTEIYSAGEALTEGAIAGLLAQCDLLRSELPLGSANLTISSPQTSIETGGPAVLSGTLTQDGAGVGNQTVLLYLDGNYFGNMTMDGGGNADGQINIPFVYKPFAVVQAVVAPNATINFGGAQSNALNFTVLFDSTKIALSDPPAYMPTFGFEVQGNLTTGAGVSLPGAPVMVTFISASELTTTNSKGTFDAGFTVPANATDGIHDVYAAFAPQGVFGPSTNFTPIEVVREPLILSVSAPSLSFAGLSTEVSGRAGANGTAISNALVTVNTPWGASSGVTDSSGRFRLDFQVSSFEFLFDSQVTVTALPPEPYIGSASASTQLGVLNPLIIVVPLMFAGLVTFEANQVRAFKKSAKMQEAETTHKEHPEAAQEPPQASGAGGGPVPEILACYKRAISLASGRFGLRFEESSTIREMAQEISRREASTGSEAFSGLMLTVEDFLYSERFDPSRVEEAKSHLATLEEVWRA